MKKVVTFCALAFVFLFTTPLQVLAGTLYFNAATDNNWSTLSNWWTDQSYTTQATTLPAITDDVVINAFIFDAPTSTVVVKTLTVPGATNVGLSGITIQATEGAIFDGISHNNPSSTVIGDVVFKGESYNQGTIIGNARFEDQSYQIGTVKGDVTLATTFYNTTPPTQGVVIIKDGSFWMGDIEGGVYGSDGIKIHTYVFNGGATQNDGTLVGNAIFTNGFNIGSIIGNVTYNGSGHNSGVITGNVTFNGTSFNNNKVIGDVIFNDNSYIAHGRYITGNAVFNGASTNNFSYITGDLVFNDTAQNRSQLLNNATFNDSSSNQSNVTEGNIVFNDTSYNSGSITVSPVFNGKSYNTGYITGSPVFNTTHYSNKAPTGGLFTVSGTAVWSGEVIGTVLGSDLAPVTKYLFNGKSSNTGTLYGEVCFRKGATNTGTVIGTITCTKKPVKEITIKELQIFLNNHGFFVSKKGKETNVFNEATVKALKKFQKKYGLTEELGVFGPKTKEFIQKFK